MITYYRTNHGALETIDKPEPGCWINVYEPPKRNSVGSVRAWTSLPTS